MPTDTRAIIGRRLLNVMMLIVVAASTTSCGFHLRGHGRVVTWPHALQQLQLRLDTDVGDRFHETLRDILVDEHQVELTSRPGPVLIISAFSRERKVLSLSTTGKVSEYLLRIRVQFALLAKDGRRLVAEQTIRLQRDYSFDTSNVLAKEVEEQRIYDDMEDDAARQLVQRVAMQLSPGGA